MRLGDCERCGGGIGRNGTSLCGRCRAADRESARRAECPACGRFLRLSADSGRCTTCSRTCVDCGHIVRFKDSFRCRACRRRRAAAEAKRPCPRCGRPGLIREATGWCGPCSNPGPTPSEPRPCTLCGRLDPKHDGLPCGRCWQKHPGRARNQTDNLAAALHDPPWWLGDVADFAAERHCMGRACVMVAGLGRLLLGGQPTHPQALLEWSRRPGRSAGPLARTLEDFFVGQSLALGLDEDARLAAGRRRRRVTGTPETLRPAVVLFCEHLVRSRERARRAGTHVRADSTIESSLAHVRDLGRFVTEERGRYDWAMVQTDDIEAFVIVNAQPGNRRRRLSSSRQFFAWARRARLVLIDPTAGVTLAPGPGFTGRTLSIAEQRRLFRRWTTGADVHPLESLVGLLAMLHALSCSELRALRLEDVDLNAHTRSRSRGDATRCHSIPLPWPPSGRAWPTASASGPAASTSS